MADFNNSTTFDPDNSSSTVNASSLNLGGTARPEQQVSPLEQEVLVEYEMLAANMRELTTTLSSLTQGPISLEIAEGLRLLERKVASVYTLMKASVYSIVLQQGDMEEEHRPEGS